MYVVIEGIDRAGKSTQIEFLRQNFPDAIFTKEPGGTDLGKKIRQILLDTKVVSFVAETFLFLADRAEHMQEVIIPNLGKLIFSDRSFISGIAYAAVKNEFSIEKLLELNSLAMQGIKPDKIIFLELSKEELLKRYHHEPLDSIEKRGIQYLLKIQNIMKDLVQTSGIDALIVDASLDKEEIFHKILAFLKD